VYRYFISFLLDSTLGLLIIYLGIQVCQFIAWNRNYTSLIFGDYGEYVVVVTNVIYGRPLKYNH
jgi:hypothetical protein